jgi:hypothetical protein
LSRFIFLLVAFAMNTQVLACSAKAFTGNQDNPMKQAQQIVLSIVHIIGTLEKEVLETTLLLDEHSVIELQAASIETREELMRRLEELDVFLQKNPNIKEQVSSLVEETILPKIRLEMFAELKLLIRHHFMNSGSTPI